MQDRYILALDEGTTSARAILFDRKGNILGTAQKEITQIFPKGGWVEQDAVEILDAQLAVARAVLAIHGVSPRQIAAIGITNQRETTLVWERDTGRPIHNAIVWQDRRTAAFCRNLREAGHEAEITARTGLLADPYFSGTKLRWLLDTVDGARARAANGDLLFGTVDSYLIWRLTGGRRHVTDATNAARTLLYDIHRGAWSAEMCALLDIPMAMLPEVLDCAAEFGTAEPAHFGAALPICGVAGDQQAALVGQACFAQGMLKSTYGTGCFAVLNTGAEPVRSTNKLLTTIGYRLAGTTTYALEGSIFVAGAAVQWMRDAMGLIDHAAQSGTLAERADTNQDV